MKMPLLSICIPTYNRAAYLEDCLASLASLPATYFDEIEVVVSDNASTDHTGQVIASFSGQLPLRYFRNMSNIGAERNIMAAAAHGTGEYVWVFGDDDEFEESALASGLHYLQEGYDLIVLNYSCWSSDMKTRFARPGLKYPIPLTFHDPNAVLGELGGLLGYISSVIIRRQMLLSTPENEWTPYSQYGFSHLYSIYRGILPGCRAICLPEPCFKRREDNCAVFQESDSLGNWIRYFIFGTALIFEELGRKGYTRQAVGRAKNQVLRDFVFKHLLTRMDDVNSVDLLRRMRDHYGRNWRFWLTCLPAITVPTKVLLMMRAGVRMVRNAARSTSPRSAVE